MEDVSGGGEVQQVSGIWVGDAQGWEEAERALRGARRIAVDLESDGFHRYQGRISLVQLAVDGRIFLIGREALSSPAPLLRVLEDPDVEIIMHSADFDIRSLDRDFDVRVAGLFDSAIGAAFLGFPSLGLGTVLEQVLGVALKKSKRLQRFDWSLRPLPEEALEYAAGDVAFLHPLADELKQRLTSLERLDWVREECARLEAVRFEPPVPPEEACLKAKGTAALNPRARRVFQELYLARDLLAQRRDVPPFKVIGNETMLRLARQAEADGDPLAGVPEGLVRRYGEILRHALRRGLEGPPLPRPSNNGAGPYRRPGPEEKDRLKRLKEWRQSVGTELGLDPSLVWPLKHLELLAGPDGKTSGFEEHTLREMGVRRWQAGVFAERLREATGSIRRVQVEGDG